MQTANYLSKTEGSLHPHHVEGLVILYSVCEGQPGLGCGEMLQGSDCLQQHIPHRRMMLHNAFMSNLYLF